MRADALRAIGVRIRDQRERLNYTQEEVALGCKTFSTIVDAIERGEKRPGTPLLYWLALAGADVTFILTGQSTAIASFSKQPDALRASAR